jgi:PhnB protein
MSIQPYLFFNGRCDEAIAFYGEALGAKLIMKSASTRTPAADHAAARGLGQQDHALLVADR